MVTTAQFERSARQKMPNAARLTELASLRPFSRQHRSKAQFDTVAVFVRAVKLADIFVVFQHVPSFVIAA